jgi:sugar phosphate permease
VLRGVGQSNENPVLCDVVEPRLRSTAIGFMNLAACFAGGLGVLVAGALKRDFGLAGVFAGISILFVVAGALLLAGYRYFLTRDVLREEEAAGKLTPSV